MNDTEYLHGIFSILSGLSIPATDTALLRRVADLMDETAKRGNVALEASEGDKATGDES